MSKALASPELSSHALAPPGPVEQRASRPARPATPGEGGRRLTAPLSATLNEAERRRLVGLDAAQGQRLQLDTLWPALRVGRLHVSKVFQQAAREYVLLDEYQVFAREPQVLDARHAHMLERLLSGASQKAIGIDLGVCPSTVSMSLGACLGQLGLRCSVSRLPLLLNLIVLSSRSAGYVARGCISDDRTGQRLVSVKWPKHALPGNLSHSEREVAELLVDGLTTREIAAQRAVSPRTVGNQLASVFTKCRLSGRVELMAHLAACTLNGEPLESKFSASPAPTLH